MAVHLFKRLLLTTSNRIHFNSSLCSTNTSPHSSSNNEETLEEAEYCSDAPVREMENPYKKPLTQCILCKYKIEVNYKNPRLLSQFVSPLTGMIYDKHITGLCDSQQQKLVDAIKKSRWNGLMPYIYREPRYKQDPKLFDPMRPGRPNPH